MPTFVLTTKLWKIFSHTILIFAFNTCTKPFIMVRANKHGIYEVHYFLNRYFMHNILSDNWNYIYKIYFHTLIVNIGLILLFRFISRQVIYHNVHWIHCPPNYWINHIDSQLRGRQCRYNACHIIPSMHDLHWLYTLFRIKLTVMVSK